MKVRNRHAAALTLLLLLALLATAPSARASFKYLHEGTTLPEMKGRDLVTGKKITCGEKDDHSTPVTLVTFWATWSPRSLDLLTDLKETQRKFGADRVHVLAVNVDAASVSDAQRDRVEAVVEELELPYAVIVDEGLEIFDRVGVIAVPSVAVLDEGHVLRYGPSGYSRRIADRIADTVARILGNEPSEADGPAKPAVRRNARADRYYNMAVQQAGRQKHRRALKNLERAVAADSTFASPHVLGGQIRLALDETEAARASFERAASLDAGSAAALAGWGRALLRLGRPEDAIEPLQRALEVDEAFTPALVDLAEIRSAAGDRAAAEELLDRARALSPHDPEVLYGTGRHLRRTGNRRAAVEAYRAALELVIRHNESR